MQDSSFSRFVTNGVALDGFTEFPKDFSDEELELKQFATVMHRLYCFEPHCCSDEVCEWVQEEENVLPWIQKEHLKWSLIAEQAISKKWSLQNVASCREVVMKAAGFK